MSGIAELEGKVAVVTGGASGIGRGIANRLAAAGMRVVIGDVEEGALEETAQALGAVGVRTDVRDLASVQALADAARDHFGAVHVVCNNAGIGPLARIADLTHDDWRWMIDVNLWGVIHGVEVFLPILRGNPDGGHIVNTASIAGLRPRPGLGAYAVTKYGIVALTETLAIELAEEGSAVGVTALIPGPVHTNIGTSTRNRPGDLAAGALHDVDLEYPAGRWKTPDEVGDVVVDAIRRGDLYAITHAEMVDGVVARYDRILDAFRQAGAAV